MAKTIRMLSIYASPTLVLEAGKLYSISDELYNKLAESNSPNNALFDAKPLKKQNEQVYRMGDAVPDPEDKADKTSDIAKHKPTFTATDEQAGVVSKDTLKLGEKLPVTTPTPKV